MSFSHKTFQVSRTHPGQARSWSRKRAHQREKIAAEKAAADAAGLSLIEYRKQVALEAEEVRKNAYRPLFHSTVRDTFGQYPAFR